MSRKTLILCLSVIGGFLVIVAVALSILYSGTGDSSESQMDKKEFALMTAVPSDAVAVVKFGEFKTALEAFSSPSSSIHYFVGKRKGKGKLVQFMDSLYRSEDAFPETMSSGAVLSVHNIGDMQPLLLIDVAKAGEPESAEVSAITSAAKAAGLYASYSDISSMASFGNVLRKRSVLMISPSDILIQASQRHLRTSVSILDSDGFLGSIEMLSAEDMLVIPNANVKKMVSGLLTRKYRSEAEFLSKFAECVAFDIRSFADDRLSLKGKSYSGKSLQNFLNVYSSVNPSRSEVSAMLPSYTAFAASVPLDDVSRYQEAYLKFAETRSLSKRIQESRNELARKAGIDPLKWAQFLDLKEVAAASFRSGSTLEKVLLIRAGNVNPSIIFKDLTEEQIKAYDGGILDFRYPGFASSLFGSLFSLQDESSFICKGKWMIIGSKAAISDYMTGRALEYTLEKYMADAGIENRLSGRDTYFASYYSVSEDHAVSEDVFEPDFLPAVKASCKDISFEPVFLTVNEGRSGMEINFDLYRTVVLKTQAPVMERDTLVTVPSGPFKVKNSGTGRMNYFYQRENNYLCLQELDGKGIWGVPFSTPICGCAQTVDLYANGKLQILFASGSKLHLIDRLGRFVSRFPVDLGKEILIGPDVYDFAGKRKYNVMILHTDNTIEMYNLQGKKPAEWKTITSQETIKGLPERIYAGGRTYWVVRTSIQTLIYGFYGGNPLTVFKGDKMIRTDSKVKASSDGTVEVTCYDGKQHIINLKEK